MDGRDGTALRLAFLLLLVAAGASAQVMPEPVGDAGGGGVDWVLKRAARVFTSDSRVFGQVHFPVIATNPNAGMTYGVLPVWLVHNARHEITQIYAPMLTYNHTFGASFSGTYYYYPSGDEKLRALLEKSQRSNQRAALEYDDRALLDGRATLLLRFNSEADGGARFYGVGPDSTANAESSERLIENLARAQLGLRFGDGLVAAAGWELRHTEVQAGPFAEQVPLPENVRTKTSYSLPRLTVSRDTRDGAFTPVTGSYSELFVEYSAAALGSSASFGHGGGQWRFYAPTGADLVTALHAQVEYSGGGTVPYTALAALGGSRSLRGYAEGRFQDRGAVFVNLEERWRVHSIDLVHSLTEFQVAPFLDAGTVFPSPGRVQARRVEPVVGVAMRAVVKPAVVGKVEVGVGREGPAIYVGIDYPF